jgi:hypothetical protein
MATLLVVSGYLAAELAGLSAPWVYMPVEAGLASYLLARLPGRVRGLTTLALVLAAASGSSSVCLASIICSRSFCSQAD